MEESARTGELRRKLEKDPASRLFAQLAEELRKEGRHDEAISVARNGLEKNPNYPSARLTLARALLDSGRPAEAKPELESIVKAAPDNIMASRLLGEALSELGLVDQALQQFEKTLRISPGDKVVIERITETKARLASMSSAPPVAPAPAPPASLAVPAGEPPSVFAAAPSPPVLPAAPLPSVFDPAPSSAPAVTLAPTPVQSLPSIPAPAAAPAAASVALDRDLASGTFSPGTLSAAGIQRHFDETAAASADASRPPAEDADATVAFGQISRSAAPSAEALRGPSELLSEETPAGDEDLGGQTLPLTSVTLADLYLQQGLKAEASAVLSQVLKEEPENAEARSKFAAVANELTQAPPAPPAAAPPPAPQAEAPVAGLKPRSRAEIRERTILSLKAFADAAEREMVNQKATERTA